MLPLHNQRAAKKPTNLSLNSDLLRQARELDINLSSVLEDALEKIVRRRLGEQWLVENQKAIAAYNDHVETHGLWSDGLRAF